MKFDFVTVDVFTSVAFGGNPLAVVLDAEGLDGRQMQAIAREFNLSETTFVMAPATDTGTARVRIFTPAVELPFAGHPTVGTAYVLAQRGAVDLEMASSTVVLEEGVGPVAVTVECQQGVVSRCQLTAAVAPEWGPAAPGREELSAVLGVGADAIRADELAPVGVSTGFPFLYVPMTDRAAVAGAAFDRQRWDELIAGAWADNIFLFAMDGADTDVHARMFGPGVGVAEDPATGSAASGLAAVLGTADATPDGTLRWSVAQGIEMGRPSCMDIEADKTAGAVTAVRVGGATVAMSSGSIEVP
jgi:trans-2,3-dihydro-3-hydroxyanthranilate isomerase